MIKTSVRANKPNRLNVLFNDFKYLHLALFAAKHYILYCKLIVTYVIRL